MADKIKYFIFSPLLRRTSYLSDVLQCENRGKYVKLRITILQIVYTGECDLTAEEQISAINESVVFISEEDDIEEAVKVMCAKGIGCILVIDQNDLVTGIITDTDIVRKFTLLDVEDKLQRKVKTFMTRPVQFVQLENMREDIEKLYLEKKLRHFPIVKGKDNHRDQIFGIVSVSDLFEAFLTRDNKEKNPVQEIVDEKKSLYVLAKSDVLFQNHENAFTGLSFNVKRIQDFGEFLTNIYSPPPALLIDLDGYNSVELKGFLAQAKKYPGRLALVSSNPNLVSLFRQYLDKTKQIMAFKPLDFGYVNWFLHKT